MPLLRGVMEMIGIMEDKSISQKISLFIRAILLFLSALSGFIRSSSNPESPVNPVTYIFIIPIMLIVVIGFQRINPLSAKVWYRNSIWLNPLNPAQPYQFFSLIGQMMLLMALTTLISSAINPEKLPAVATPLSTGVGLLLGIKLCQLIYSGKNP